jgi:hypothetical protein
MLVAFIWFCCAAVYLAAGIGFVALGVRMKNANNLNHHDLAIMVLFWPIVVFFVLLIEAGSVIGNIVMKLGTKK